jgi:nitrate reductase assembly molybdenum cofactor insertion protein NarJ
MMNTQSTLAVAAHLLEYPHPRFADEARAAAEWLDAPAPEAAVLARCFACDVAGISTGALEEAYTAAFDFASVATIYAGEHLFGPSEARASFLSRLRAMQRAHGVAASSELPDHVTELLRLAAAMPESDERNEMLRDAVLPTARAALQPLQQQKHPFANAVAAVIAVVEGVATAAPERTESVEATP